MSAKYNKLLLKVVLALFSLLPPTQVLAQDGQLSKASTFVIGHAKGNEGIRFPLRVVNWNIHKAEDANWLLDLSAIASRSQLMLLQEVVSIELLRMNTAFPKVRFEMVKAFQRLEGDYAGVALGSTIKPLRTWSLLSEVTEPVLSTPKSIIVAEFAIEGSKETLLVANIHAINFVGQDSFEKHCFQLFKMLNEHKGPQIIAGDFNTWSTSRINFLYRSMKLFKFGRIMHKESGFLTLDHMFVRGLKVKAVYDLNFVESSDHKPIMADLVL